jgi:hypothetical protein
MNELEKNLSLLNRPVIAIMHFWRRPARHDFLAACFQKVL